MSLLSLSQQGKFSYGATDDVTITTKEDTGTQTNRGRSSWRQVAALTTRVSNPLPTLSWERLSLKLLNNDGSSKVLLSDVSGVVVRGEVVAILGPSGAGKTTLLDVLFGSLPKNGLLTGQIRNWPVDQDLIQELKPDIVTPAHRRGNNREEDGGVVAYIPQHDLFFETLTLGEHLNFQVQLRTGKDDLDLVSRVTDSLSLGEAVDTLISDLSGGERRRLSVATELLSEPTFLLCDEITTGLDMYQALQLVRSLKGLSGTGVLCTIHQPPTQVFSLFDRSMFMVGGCIKSEGTTHQILEQFVGLGYTCPMDNNPADFVIRVLSSGSYTERTYKKFLDNVERMYRQSKSKYISDFLIEVQSKTMNKGVSTIQKRALSLVDEWWLLLRRTATYTARDKVYKRVRVVQVVFISVVLGLLYLNTAPDNVQNITGSLFFLLINLSLSGMFATLQTFPNELPVFRREYKNKVARVGPYFLAKTLAEFPFYLVYPTIYITIAYFLVGYGNSAGKFFVFWFVMLLVYHTSLSVGYLISSGAPTPELANAVGLPVGVIFFLFAGYFITVPTIPKILRWFAYFSYMYFGYQGIMTNQLKGVIFNNCTGNCSKWTSGDQVLEVFGFAGKNVLLTDVMVLLLLLIGFRFAAYITLVVTTKKKRY